MAKISSTKPDKRVMGGRDMVKVAAIQAPCVVFNKEKSIDIACRKIKEAGANGAELVGFCENYIPVFPAFYTSSYHSKKDEWFLWNIGLQDNAIVVPSDDTDRIGQACRDAGVYCVLGVHELSDADGVRTFYNTQIIFGADGKILGRHRKLKPTYNERVYWGEGDGSDLGIYKTSIGRIGSLLCWEHHTILVRAAQMLMGEEFHIASWPGTWTYTGPGERNVDVNFDPLAHGCDAQLAAREYAFESGSYVISAHTLLREEDFEPEYRSLLSSDDLHFDWATGGSCIIDPFGDYVTPPVHQEDTIVYGDCYANKIKGAKAFFDGLGHYSRPDVAKLLLNIQENKNLNIVTGANLLSTAPDYQYIKQISEEYELRIEKLEKLVGQLEDRLALKK